MIFEVIKLLIPANMVRMSRMECANMNESLPKAIFQLQHK